MSDSPVAAGADQAEPVSLGVRGRKVVMAIAFAVAAVALQLLRQRGYRTWNTVWAEDGLVYASDAYRHPALSTLFRGYAGYAQFVPRALVLPARLLPVDALGAYCAAVSALVCALLALFVYRSSMGWIRSRRLRAVIAMLAVLAPTAFYEVNANLANLGWPLLYAAAWAVASRRDSTGDVALRATVVLLAVLTTPVTFLLVPVALAVAVWRRSRGDATVAAALVVGAVVQAIAINASGPVPPFSAFSAGDVPVVYGVRVLASDVVGERWLPDLWVHLDVALVVLAAVVALAFVVIAAPRRMARSRWVPPLVAALGSVVVFTASLWERGSGGVHLVSGEYNPSDSRYVIVPALLLATAVVLLADASPRRWLRPAVAAQIIAIVLVSYALVGPRSGGPPWQPAVDEATALCRGGSVAVAKVRVSPDPLTMDVPCDRLR